MNQSSVLINMKRLALILPILFLWFPNVSHAAIALDASANSGTGGATSPSTSLSWSHTTSGSNRLLVVAVSTGGTVSGVTYNGVAMTMGVSHTGSPYGGSDYLWYLANPASGANTITVTTTTSIATVGLSISYTGAAQSVPVDVTGSVASSGSVLSLSLNVTTTVDNDWLVSMASIGQNNSNLTGGANTTARQVIANPYGAPGIGDSNATQTPTGSHGQTWTNTVASGGNLLIIAIKPFTAAPVVPSILSLVRSFWIW